MSELIECPAESRPDNCPKKHATDWGVWIRWSFAILATLALAVATGALRQTVAIEHRVTTNEVDIHGLQVTDTEIKAAQIRKEEHDRSDLAEIKADIKKLLGRR